MTWRLSDGHSRAVAITLLAAMPMALLEAWSLPRVLGEFSSGGLDARTVVLLVVVQGGIFMAIALAVMGAAWQRPGLTVLGAGLMFLEAFPLIFSFAWLAVLVSGLFLLAGRNIGPIRGAPLAGARILGVLAALWALTAVPSLPRLPLFGVFLVAALCGVVAVGWWPSGGAAGE